MCTYTFYALAKIGISNENLFSKLEQMIRSKREIKISNNSLKENVLALSTFSEINFKNYEKLKKYYQIWKMQNSEYEIDETIFGDALSNLTINEQLHFFQENDANNIEFRKKVRLHLYMTAGFRSGQINAIPLDFFSFILEDLKHEPDNNDLSFSISKIQINSLAEEEKFIETLKSATWLKGQKLNEILANLPKKTQGTAIVKYVTELYLSKGDEFSIAIFYLMDKPEFSQDEIQILKPLLNLSTYWTNRLRSTLEEKKLIPVFGQ